MKRIIALALLLMITFTGCKTKKADNSPKEKSESSQSSEAGDNSASSGADASAEKDEHITDKSGKTVSSEDLTKMIEKVNDPSTDEQTKKKLLEEIDYILKQSEK